MDTKDENKRRLASRIVFITSVLLCSLVSWFFDWNNYFWCYNRSCWGSSAWLNLGWDFSHCV